jgi:nicotinate-nucleotide adenylyltransferase
MKIGLFGGTFNPPHTGHLIVVESVRDQLRLDKVLFIPSAQPPNKRDPAIAPAHDRLQMTLFAVETNSDFEVSDVEVNRGGMSYSIDTVLALGALHPSDELSLIIGSDNLLEFDTWKDPTEILARVDLVAMSRPGTPIPDAKNKFVRAARFVNVPSIGISSTDIRRRVKLGRSIRYLVPRSVEDYIYSRHLYS